MADKVENRILRQCIAAERDSKFRRVENSVTCGATYAKIIYRTAFSHPASRHPDHNEGADIPSASLTPYNIEASEMKSSPSFRREAGEDSHGKGPAE
jgi:hypothetical protein